MPLYQYLCKSCSYDFEIIQNYNDKRLKKCPKCKKYKLIQKFSIPSSYIGPKTVGSQADFNASKISEDEMAYRIVESRTKKSSRKGAIQRKGKSMFQDISMRRQIMKASPKQKQKYIETGKT